MRNIGSSIILFNETKLPLTNFENLHMPSSIADLIQATIELNANNALESLFNELQSHPARFGDYFGLSLDQWQTLYGPRSLFLYNSLHPQFQVQKEPRMDPSRVAHFPHETLAQRLKHLNVDFDTSDLKNIVKDTHALRLCLDPYIDVEQAEKKIKDLRSQIQTTTRNAIGRAFSFHILKPFKSGQSRPDIHYAISESGGLLAAKVYKGHSTEYEREVKVSESLNNEYLVKFLAHFSINGFHVIIMPLFALSLQEVLPCDGSSAPLSLIRAVSTGCYEALKYMHSKGLIFVDLKPSNIMLHASDHGQITLVDYGAVLPIGDSIIECSNMYCLYTDPATATERVDWLCLGTTLAIMGGCPVERSTTAKSLTLLMEDSTRDEAYKNVVFAFLEPFPSADDVGAAVMAFMNESASRIMCLQLLE